MAKVVIIGGGIGGLTAAACLRVRGVEAQVYERTAELREVGAALGIWPNATRVLERIGVLEELIKHAHVPPVGALRDWRGTVIKRMLPIDAGVPTVFAHRAELHRTLIGALPPGSVHLNKTCTGVQREGVHVRGVFADGTFSEWGEVLIGADGIRSAIRELLLKDGMPAYRGYVAWRGVAHFDPGEEIVGESWGRGQRFGFIPLGMGRVGWWATANKPGEQGTKTCGLSRGAWKEELLVRFGGWHEPIAKLIEATAEADILCNAILDREPTGKAWGAGPITLMGDAAHPMTPNLGQGACMAIEDAAVLAHAVATIPAAEMALRVFEKTRLARTAMVVRESLKFGKLGQWEGRVACVLRDGIIRWAPEGRLRKQFHELWMYDAWNEALQMP